MLNKQEIIKKKHGIKGKTVWCTPRKVRSTANVIKLDNLLALGGKPKKKRRKRVRKTVKKVKRIDILAQPKSVKYRTESKHHPSDVVQSAPEHKITGVTPTKAGNLVSARKKIKSKKLKTKNVPENLIIKSKQKNSSPIVLPRKIGLQLFSIVTKRLKELTDSKSM